MVYYMMCDNDSLYSNTMLLGDYDNSKPFLGTFNGLMVVMEACMEIYSTDGNRRRTSAARCSTGRPTRAARQRVGERHLAERRVERRLPAVGHRRGDDTPRITTLTTTTQIVPGSWQQLPVH